MYFYQIRIEGIITAFPLRNAIRRGHPKHLMTFEQKIRLLEKAIWCIVSARNQTWIGLFPPNLFFTRFEQKI